MINSIYKEFCKNNLTEKHIIYVGLTELGGALFPYMCMLGNTERTIEAALIEALRKIIFEAREDYSNSKITKENISVILTNVYEKLQIQMIMVDTIQERKWEKSLFHSYFNDLLIFIDYMKPETNKE